MARAPEDETAENQLRELRQVAERLGWRVIEEFVDQGISGAKGRDKRPALDGMLEAVIRGEVDVVAAWSVDRLGRSLQDLIGVLDDIRGREVDLYLHQQGLDTATPWAGRCTGCSACSPSSSGRSSSSASTPVSARAKAQGRVLGRPEIVPSLVEDMKALRREGYSLQVIADRLGVGRGTVEKYTKGIEAPWT